MQSRLAIGAHNLGENIEAFYVHDKVIIKMRILWKILILKPSKF
jgi:hypothetical protein